MSVRITAFRSRADLFAHPILLSMGLLDELNTGFPVAALPLLRDRLHLSYTQVGLLFTAAAFSGMLLEPFINLWSDRSSKKPWILCGLLLLALTDALIGNVTSYVLLLCAFMVGYPSGGAAIDLSQAVVIDAAPEEGVRTMTRWTMLSGIGDFLSPLVVAAFVGIGLGWTALCWLAVAIWLSAAIALFPLRFPARAGLPTETGQDEEKEISRWAALREALRDPLLLRWCVLTLIPTMLDEVFLGFVALYLHDVQHIAESLIALILVLQMAASFLGLFILDRLLKHRRLSSSRVLFWLSLTTLIGVAGFLAVHWLWSIICSLLVISFCCAGWYPLALAEAYARKPDSSGVVRAIRGLGAPLEMALPGVIGFIAARSGVLAGLAVLGLAPVFMLVLLPTRRSR